MAFDDIDALYHDGVIPIDDPHHAAPLSTVLACGNFHLISGVKSLHDLKYLRRLGDNAHEAQFSQFSGDGAKDARTPGHVLRVQEHGGIVVEANA